MNKDMKYLYKNFKPIKVTEALREEILNNPLKYSNCESRIRMGLFYTDDEKEKYIEESLERPLPGDKIKCKKLIKNRNN